MEKRFAGPRGASIIGLKSGERDLTENNHWGHLVRTYVYIYIYIVKMIVMYL